MDNLKLTETQFDNLQEFSKYLTTSSKITSLVFNSHNLLINDTNYIIISSKFLESKLTFIKTSNSFVFENKKIFNFLIKIIKKKLIEHKLSYCNILELVGLSFTTTIKQNTLRLNLGYNHSIYYIIPKDIIMHTKKKSIYIFSNSLQRLNFVIKELINFRKLNVYKLKGIKLKDQLYIKKKKKITN
tara:strand:+ start:15770 stop:16327 length:558 start_codon:yes stop_codon:yes gene_type:complete